MNSEHTKYGKKYQVEKEGPGPPADAFTHLLLYLCVCVCVYYKVPTTTWKAAGHRRRAVSRIQTFKTEHCTTIQRIRVVYLHTLTFCKYTLEHVELFHDRHVVDNRYTIPGIAVNKCNLYLFGPVYYSVLGALSLFLFLVIRRNHAISTVRSNFIYSYFK